MLENARSELTRWQGSSDITNDKSQITVTGCREGARQQPSSLVAQRS
jgi:hypothetical protein